jgi:hypothetical protein
MKPVGEVHLKLKEMLVEGGLWLIRATEDTVGVVEKTLLPSC